MGAGLITIRKDGLGAALGIVGVAVPSDVHCEATTRSEITVDRECLERECLDRECLDRVCFGLGR